MIFVTLGLMLGLYMTPHTPANVGKRMLMLIGFAFTNGKRLPWYTWHGQHVAQHSPGPQWYRATP